MLESSFYDLERDSNFKDIGLLQEFKLYDYDYKLPYSFNLAKNSGSIKSIVGNLNIKLHYNKSIRPREYIKYKMISWYLIKYGINIFQQNLGYQLKHLLSLSSIVLKEENINGIMVKAITANTVSFFKTQIYEYEDIKAITDVDKLEKLKLMLWNGLSFTEFNELKEHPKFVTLYKPCKLNLQSIQRLLYTEKKSNPFTFINDFDVKMIIKIQSIPLVRNGSKIL